MKQGYEPNADGRVVVQRYMDHTHTTYVCVYISLKFWCGQNTIYLNDNAKNETQIFSHGL